MGQVFKRKESKYWQIRYRVWDSVKMSWGRRKVESTGVMHKREAEAILFEREQREERRRAGLEVVLLNVTLDDALTAFVDENKKWDAVVPTRNRRGTHPVTGDEVHGTAWWVRTLDFARDVRRFFAEDGLKQLSDAKHLAAFDRWLKLSGGAEQNGVGQSTRHKVHTWCRRFVRWCVQRGYLSNSGYEGAGGFTVPKELAKKKERVITTQEYELFWREYQKLPLKARVRVGLAMFTGARAGEIDTIRVSDVAVAFATVRRRIWKGRSDGECVESVVSVPQSLIADIEAWIQQQHLRGDDLLLPIRCQAGNKFLSRWRTSARGIRRTVLSRLHEANVPLRVIQEVAGHGKLSTTQKYLEVDEAMVSGALLHHLDWGRKNHSVTKTVTNSSHQAATVSGIPRHIAKTEEKKVG